jgi:hypothetical protein
MGTSIFLHRSTFGADESSYYVDIQHLTGLDLAVKAPLGSKFYRMPAVAIVEDFLTQKLQSMPSEGGFYDDNCCRGHPDPYIDENILVSH